MIFSRSLFIYGHYVMCDFMMLMSRCYQWKAIEQSLAALCCINVMWLHVAMHDNS